VTTLKAIGGLGPVELIIILVIVLLIFGAGKLPQIGDALGKSISAFKSASSGNDDSTVDVTPKANAEAKRIEAAHVEAAEDAAEVEVEAVEEPGKA